jgi:hypothetical protein
VLKIVIAGRKCQHRRDIGCLDIDDSPLDAGVGLMAVHINRGSVLHAFGADEHVDVKPTALTVWGVAQTSDKHARQHTIAWEHKHSFRASQV